MKAESKKNHQCYRNEKKNESKANEIDLNKKHYNKHTEQSCTSIELYKKIQKSLFGCLRQLDISKYRLWWRCGVQNECFLRAMCRLGCWLSFHPHPRRWLRLKWHFINNISWFSSSFVSSNNPNRSLNALCVYLWPFSLDLSAVTGLSAGEKFECF